MNEMDIEHRLSVLEQDGKSTHRRLDNLEKLVESVHIIASETKEMREDLNSMVERVDEIERRPQRRYDTLITAAITGAVTSIIGLLVGLLF